MTLGSAAGHPQDRSTYLMALHSSSQTLGVAVQDLSDSGAAPRIALFEEGRGLAKSLLRCVQELLPASAWSQLQGLAVATGPGGFTGTRLTVVMARTLAQQLGCPLLGVSSFALMAARFGGSLSDDQVNQPFWIVKRLPRRGTVAGCYRLQPTPANQADQGVVEIEAPHLLEGEREVAPAFTATEAVEEDVRRLLSLCAAAHRCGRLAPWSTVLPLYPTSPVGPV